MAGIYNYPEAIQGDTLQGLTLTLEHRQNGVLKDLTGATITLEVFRSKTSKTYLTLSSANANEILIVDPALCVVQILDVNAPAELVDGMYFYRIKAVWVDGYTHTFVGGTYSVKRFPEVINPYAI